jgi:two-component system cell cycle sensor histidine kinase/response regulator CckA
MTQHPDTHVVLFAVSAVILAALGLYVLRRRTFAAKAGAVLALATAEWALGNALELGSANFPAKVFWDKMQYLGLVIVPVAWLVYVLLYTEHRRWLTRRNLVLLCIVPFVTLILVFTNEAHGLMWRNVRFRGDMSVTTLIKDRGIGFWVFVAYAYILLLLGALRLVRLLVRARWLRRWQAFALLMATGLPWMAHMLDTFGLMHPMVTGIIPIALVIAGIVGVWGVFGLRLGNIVPVAREVVIEGMSDGVVVLDAQGVILDLNPAAQRLVGCTASEGIGRPVAEVWSDWEDCVKHIRDRGEVVLQEGSVRRVYDVRISPFSDWRDQPVGQVVVLHDITDHKLAEDALRKAEQAKALLLDSISEFVTYQDKDLRIVWTNRAVAESADLSLAKLVGHRCYQTWQRRDVPCEECPALKAMDTGQPQQAKLTTPDGKVFSVRGYPVRDESGEIVGAVEVASDISEREDLEQQFRQAQKMEAVGRLAGGVAHDFNNLLTAITGYADLLLCDPGITDAMQADLTEIANAADRAATLTRQLLAFARKQVLQPRVLDLNALVGDLAKMIRRLIGEDIELTMMLDPALKSVEADPGQIEQVIMNLAVNARDAMPQGGELVIGTANVELDRAQASQRLGIEPGPYVMLSIRDTGMGMDAETLGHLFEPFFTTKGQGKGTGLGLSTVFGIVRQHKGAILPRSEPGRGTTFEVYLPRVETDEGSIVDAASSELPGGSETVLLAEDEDAVRALAHAVLQRHGYTVLEAANGAEAIATCEQHAGPIHLLLTDVIMPGMSGCELADRLARLYPEAKVLYMSGHTDDTIASHGILDPGVAFLQKPFAPSALARRVREVLGDMAASASP